MILTALEPTRARIAEGAILYWYHQEQFEPIAPLEVGEVGCDLTVERQY